MGILLSVERKCFDGWEAGSSSVVGAGRFLSIVGCEGERRYDEGGRA